MMQPGLLAKLGLYIVLLLTHLLDVLPSVASLIMVLYIQKSLCRLNRRAFRYSGIVTDWTAKIVIYCSARGPFFGLMRFESCSTSSQKLAA